MLPPGPRYPLALQTLGWIARPGPFMERCRDRYGDAFSLRMYNEGTWVMFSDPAAVKQIFTGDPELLHSGEANGILRPIVGPNSVLLLDDRAHMSQRKLLLPPFHGERMKAYGELMTAVAEEEIAAWPGGEVVATRPAMQRITLEIVMRAIFGLTDTSGMERMRAALTSMLDWTTKPSRLVLLVAAGPKGIPRIPEYRAVMGARAARAPPAGLGAAVLGRRALPGRGDQGDPAAAAGAPDRAAALEGADGDRRLGAAGGRERRPLHLHHAPPRRHLPRPARVPARALPRAARRHLHLDPVRRRRAALPRGELRAVRDGGRAAGSRAALCF